MADEVRQTFARLRFTGARYTGTVFPVEVLPELAAYRDLILTIARTLYLDDHPQRRKVPRGFEASLGLVLAGVEGGSAVPVLARVAVAGAATLPIAMTTYFDEARNLVEQAALCASAHQGLPARLKAKVSPKFGMFGRSLAANERIYLSGPASETPAPYDIEVRKEIMLSLAHEYLEDVSYVGEITAADRRTRDFKLTTVEGQVIPFKLDSQSQVKNLYQWLADQPSVILKGQALRRRDGALLDFEVASVALVEEDLGVATPTAATMPIADQFATIAQLETGWLDGRGYAYDRGTLDTICALLQRWIELYELPWPFIYPTAENEVRVEWPSPAWDVVITFNREGSGVWLFATATDSDDDVDRHFSTKKTGDTAQLALELSRLLKGQEV